MLIDTRTQLGQCGRLATATSPYSIRMFCPRMCWPVLNATSGSTHVHRSRFPNKRLSLLGCIESVSVGATRFPMPSSWTSTPDNKSSVRRLRSLPAHRRSHIQSDRIAPSPSAVATSCARFLQTIRRRHFHLGRVAPALTILLVRGPVCGFNPSRRGQDGGHLQ